MKPIVLGFMGTMSHIVSVLQKTRTGLLIDMRRANALAGKKEVDKIEALNSTVVRFYNTTVKHLLEILELVKQMGGMKLSPSHFRAAEELACCLPYMCTMPMGGFGGCRF